MSVREILNRKGSRLVTCRPEDTVESAATILTSNEIGALPVRDAEGRLVGVISERDIVRGLSERGKVMALHVRDLMTSGAVVVPPDASLKDVWRIMAQRHIRHLPVVEDNKLIGMISVRDVVEFRLEQSELERNVLKDYAITGR